ncbi:hypothetical protein like AT4G02830 [Hibiscus trionum]|uniref:Uncharacterized protein n=1 Tax=Hibiscus trionum TaxID=183268 RepID=A0A9W7HA84_HIBTR|nr:hypothetical protein like AT4G02830 [Hibiscus trionum]
MAAAVAAVAAVEDVEVCFEEAMSWLPSHVLDEPIWETKTIKNDVKYSNRRRRHSKLPVEPFPPSGRSQKPRYGGSISGGPGMQAFFLDSGKKSSGTGVFLPQRTGTHLHSSTRPACSPVLLPSRVVQALNLNVQELGLQISPRRHLRNNSARRGDELKNSVNFNKLKDGHHDASTICCETGTCSPDIFLPQEWTY